MSDKTTLVDPASGRSWRVPNDRLLPWHTVRIAPNGWRMSHPLDCDLVVCDFNRAAEQWEAPPDDEGVYEWDDQGWREAEQ